MCRKSQLVISGVNSFDFIHGNMSIVELLVPLLQILITTYSESLNTYVYNILYSNTISRYASNFAVIYSCFIWYAVTIWLTLSSLFATMMFFWMTLYLLKKHNTNKTSVSWDKCSQSIHNILLLYIRKVLRTFCLHLFDPWRINVHTGPPDHCRSHPLTFLHFEITMKSEYCLDWADARREIIRGLWIVPNWIVFS